MKFLGHWRIFFFRVAKTEKKCPEEHIKESPFSKGKNLLNFWDSERTLHFNLAEKFVRVVKTVTYVALEDFEEKNMFETLHIVPNFLGIWDKKNQSFIQKIFFRVVTKAIRASTGKFCGKSILLPEKLCLLLEIWICSNCFCPVANKLSRWAKTAMHVFRGNICGNFTLKNCFFFNFSDFEQRKLVFLWKNNGTFVKTVG